MRIVGILLSVEVDCEFHLVRVSVLGNGQDPSLPWTDGRSVPLVHAHRFFSIYQPLGPELGFSYFCVPLNVFSKWCLSLT